MIIIVMIRFCKVKMVMKIFRLVRPNICCLYVNLLGYSLFTLSIEYQLQYERVKNVSTVGVRVFFKTNYVRSKFYKITVKNELLHTQMNFVSRQAKCLQDFNFMIVYCISCLHYKAQKCCIEKILSVIMSKIYSIIQQLLTTPSNSFWIFYIYTF